MKKSKKKKRVRPKFNFAQLKQIYILIAIVCGSSLVLGLLIVVNESDVYDYNQMNARMIPYYLLAFAATLLVALIPRVNRWIVGAIIGGPVLGLIMYMYSGQRTDDARHLLQIMALWFGLAVGGGILLSWIIRLLRPVPPLPGRKGKAKKPEAKPQFRPPKNLYEEKPRLPMKASRPEPEPPEVVLVAEVAPEEEPAPPPAEEQAQPYEEPRAEEVESAEENPDEPEAESARPQETEPPEPEAPAPPAEETPPAPKPEPEPPVELPPKPSEPESRPAAPEKKETPDRQTSTGESVELDDDEDYDWLN